MAESWQSGEVVAVREVWRGRVWKARPAVVVEDSAKRIALWMPRGSPTMVPPGSGIPRDEWMLEPKLTRSDALRVTRPGEGHSILHFWRGRFVGWYVNLERPLTRSAAGFDYLDLELDVLCRPDGSHEVLDEDEFEEAQRLGVIAPDEAAAVRAEAERVVAEWPFPTGWEGFRPDPAWGIPELPRGWDVV